MRRDDMVHLDDTAAAHEVAASLELVEAVSGLLRADTSPRAQQVAMLRAVADAVETLGAPVHCEAVPFVPGRRPTFEAGHPGLGASDCVAVLTGDDPAANRAIVLFDLGAVDPRMHVEATVRLADRRGRELGPPLPGWDRRPVDVGDMRPGARQQVTIQPETEIPADELGFTQAFLRRAAVDITVTWNGVPVAADRHWLDVCDVRNLGSLYLRVVDHVVAPDTARQAEAARQPDPGIGYHPWYPVLLIGTDKASLYTRALLSDIVQKENHLSDPAWLLRVGVYLELLTCLGIFEAVRDELGDLLTPEERDAFEHAAVFDDLRDRVNVDGWRKVWAMRKIAFPRLGVPRSGPVSMTNVLNQKRATLAFLHVHHEDLKHAIELAGPNHHNAQETWQRVFRDAERAVLRKARAAFPALEHLPAPMREMVLWQQWGIAGQQGLYPTACTEYRASMNMVADWAKARGLMDHTGAECVPLRVSLLEALMHRPERVPLLQRGDGYDEVVDPAADDADLTVGAHAETSTDASTAEFEALLGLVPVLQLLSPDELRQLATQARPLFAMPQERIIVQGGDGDSLFVVADGDVEVLVRRDGVDTKVDTMGRGAVFGEMALLTGEARTATVRAVDNALVFEIGEQQYRPILQAHPEWLDRLTDEMVDRLRRREATLSELDRRAAQRIRNRIRERFFGGDG